MRRMAGVKRVDRKRMTDLRNWNRCLHSCHCTSGGLAGILSGYFGARYLAKERIFDSLISIFSALYIT